MRAIFAVVLLVGLGLAGFAVYMAQNYIEGYQAALAKERAGRQNIELVDGFIIAKALKYGETLEKEDVRKVKWPKAAMPDGMFTTVEALFPKGDDRRRVILRAMEKGEVLIEAKLTKPGEEAGITSRLQRGQRAFAIKVDVASGVSGFLRPGDRVDVYWTGRAGGKQDARGEFTKLIEANVSLVAIDQTADEEVDTGTIARTVTVAASPQQVAALAQAQTTGRLSLSLVGAEDDTVASAIEVDQSALLGIEVQQEVVEQREEQRVCTIKTRKGGEIKQIPIPCTN
ncbi:Flp pilus assembly protein CpaB [Thiosulfatihalobacter marinus]|jgi:pilus assembly protein CpaB|uniref:Flp pilus assembly protein CpaB n=1 Tax=Thiosulfatihalobacter marinus TaxID=2792481 RepID=UPI0018D941D4|nr:Flp pilus assembly protein CpaB [Thiosulfatihalobacter marinus]